MQWHWSLQGRRAADRDGLHRPTDLTDEEWGLAEALIPPAKQGGNKRKVDVRAVLDGILLVLGTGCRWHLLPDGLPPRSTLHGYLKRWEDDRTLERLHQALYPGADPGMPGAGLPSGDPGRAGPGGRRGMRSTPAKHGEAPTVDLRARHAARP